jgi:hypothetical protein
LPSFILPFFLFWMSLEILDINMNSRRNEPSLSLSARDYGDQQHVQEVASTSSGQQSSSFSLQRLSLDYAVSPLMSRPTAPFDKSERKKAHTSAVYYSECFLRGIGPVEADTAAKEAQGQYDKWWIKCTHNNHKDGARKEKPKESALQSRPSFQNDSSSAHEHGEHVVKWRRTISGTSSPYASVSVAPSQEPEPVSIHNISTIAASTPNQVKDVKMKLISDLRASEGSTETTEVLGCLEFLEAYYRSKSWDGRGSNHASAPFTLDGRWLTLSKPTYNESKGRSEKGEYLYSMGRMSFDMFKPTSLLCSIQAVFNEVRPIDPKKPDRPLQVPRGLMKEVQKGEAHLRTYE